MLGSNIYAVDGLPNGSYEGLLIASPCNKLPNPNISTNDAALVAQAKQKRRRLETILIC